MRMWFGLIISAIIILCTAFSGEWALGIVFLLVVLVLLTMVHHADHHSNDLGRHAPKG